MKTKYFFATLIFILTLLFTGCGNQTDKKEESKQIIAVSQPVVGPSNTEDITTPGSTKIINIIVNKNGVFPDTLEAKLKDKLIISLTSVDVEETLTVEGYEVTATLKIEETTKLEFVAEKAGTFKITCIEDCEENSEERTVTLIVR